MPSTVAERIGVMWRLAPDAWAFAGRALPEYDRRDTPVLLVRREDR